MARALASIKITRTTFSRMYPRYVQMALTLRHALRLKKYQFEIDIFMNLELCRP